LIRRATAADAAQIAEFGRGFFAESHFARLGIEYDPQSVRDTIERVVDGAGVALIAEDNGQWVGIAAAVAFPLYMNAAQMTAQELFWWVHPAHRGKPAGIRLLSAMEEWAHEAGCRTFSMIALAALESPAERIYERRGYVRTESTWFKELAWASAPQ
jgi:GNAT superfamily N-acetyltransferase